MKIAFAGGGTAGHVNPNLAIIELCRRDAIEVMYFGTADGIERELVEREGDIPFHDVPSERLRRYFDWRTFLAPFRVLKGMWVAWRKLRKLRPDVLFSKGGFAAFPVVVGAWLARIPVIAHESDLTPGLANRMSFPFIRTICVGFRKTLDGFSKRNRRKAVYTGSPVRNAFENADPARAIERFGLDPERRILLVFGGSQGAQHINEVVREALDALIGDDNQIVHACGAGKLSPDHQNIPHYHQHEYIHEGFSDLMTATSLAICRAGANTLAELLIAGTPSLLIPLPTQSSRGDQLANSEDFAEQGFGEMIRDEALNPETLIEKTHLILDHHAEYVARIQERPVKIATEHILEMLKETAASA